jgi:hypothetical protein
MFIFSAVKSGRVEHMEYNVDKISLRSQGSSVSIVTGYGLDDRGAIPDGGRGFFL